MDAKPVKIGRHVALIGFMGCGKSTVGPRLALRLQVPFVDTDAEIEAATGRLIPTIFAEDGEAAFRAHETSALQRVLASKPQVIATGGGLVTLEGNWELLRRRATVVWLRVPFSSLKARLASCSDRPLLRQDPSFERAQRLYAAREPLYARAPIHVDATLAPDAVAAAIAQQLGTDQARRDPDAYAD